MRASRAHIRRMTPERLREITEQMGGTSRRRLARMLGYASENTSMVTYIRVWPERTAYVSSTIIPGQVVVCFSDRKHVGLPFDSLGAAKSYADELAAVVNGSRRESPLKAE